MAKTTCTFDSDLNRQLCDTILSHQSNFESIAIANREVVFTGNPATAVIDFNKLSKWHEIHIRLEDEQYQVPLHCRYKYGEYRSKRVFTIGPEKTKACAKVQDAVLHAWGHDICRAAAYGGRDADQIEASEKVIYEAGDMSFVANYRDDCVLQQREFAFLDIDGPNLNRQALESQPWMTLIYRTFLGWRLIFECNHRLTWLNDKGQLRLSYEFYDFCNSLDVDPTYLHFCVMREKWCARLTPKSNYLPERFWGRPVCELRGVVNPFRVRNFMERRPILFHHLSVTQGLTNTWDEEVTIETDVFGDDNLEVPQIPTQSTEQEIEERLADAQEESCEEPTFSEIRTSTRGRRF